MRIDRLTATNFKGFARCEYAFHPEVNLLVGVNGTGKTSLLDALSVAIGGWFLGLRGYDTRHIRQHEVRLQANQATPKNGTSRRAASVNWETQYPCSVEASGLVMGKELTWTRTLTTPRGRTTYGGAREMKDLATRTEAAVRDGGDIVLPLLSYYGTGRLWDIPREQFQVKGEKLISRREKRSRLAGYRNSVDPRISVSDLTRWIAEQSWIEFQQAGEVTPAFSAVKCAILGCVERARDLYFDPRRGQVVLEIDGQGAQPFDNLSDGQRTVMAMAGDIAQKAATLNPSLGADALRETPGVVLIDELDLHLHPVWQRRVIEDLRTTFPRIQFFASTHSPFLIQSLRSGEELLMLDGEPTAQLANKTLADIAEGIMGVRSPEVSSRYLEMKNTATDYLNALDQAVMAPEAKQAAFQEALAKSIAPFADNPAYQAFLELKRASKLGE